MNANLAKPHGKATPRPRLRGFTLVEMMVVIVIAAIVMAIAIPSFVKMTSGSAVRSGTRLVASQIRLTRQEAISQRRTIALLLPTTLAGLPDELCYVAMKPAYVTGNASPFTFVEWVEGAKWLYIPRGAVIAEADTYKGITDGAGAWVQSPADNAPCKVNVARDKMTDLYGTLSGGDVPVRAIVFSSTGRVLGPNPANVTIAQTTYSGGVWIPRNAGDANTQYWVSPNQFNIEINPFTGRIKIETPDKY